MNKEEQIDDSILSNAILKIRNADEAEKFFMDVFSQKELQTLNLRLNIAKMLSESISYVEIERRTGASSATIAKISESIKYGNEGLRTILERLKRARRGS